MVRLYQNRRVRCRSVADLMRWMWLLIDAIALIAWVTTLDRMHHFPTRQTQRGWQLILTSRHLESNCDQWTGKACLQTSLVGKLDMGLANSNILRANLELAIHK
jgi:hypothetical protein